MPEKRPLQRALDRMVAPPPPRERGERVHLAPVYVLLIALVVVATLVSIMWRDTDLVDRFGPNLATESLGILLTVVFVRRFMEQAERSRRLRASVGALRKTRRALQDLVDTWTTTLKGCLSKREPDELSTVQQLCAPDMAELLFWCDPRATRQGSEELWVHSMRRHFREAQVQLDQVIGTFASTLEPDYVEAVDALVSDPFLRGFAELTATELEPQQWRVALNAVRGLRMAHFERLLRTIDVHNRFAAEVAGIRGRASMPRSSTLGVDLPPDHDLKIETALDDSWWRSTPPVGSLRMS